MNYKEGTRRITLLEDISAYIAAAQWHLFGYLSALFFKNAAKKEMITKNITEYIPICVQ
jgi:hypothetical protein